MSNISTYEEAPGAVGAAAEGEDPIQQGRDMIHPTSKHADYTTTVRDDWGSCIIEPHAESGEMVKYHYRIFRVPAQKLFILKHCADATDTDRTEALRMLATMPHGGWGRWARHAEEVHNPTTGNRHWRVLLGTFLDDPLLRLEVEQLMLDLDDPAADHSLMTPRRELVA